MCGGGKCSLEETGEWSWQVKGWGGWWWCECGTPVHGWSCAEKAGAKGGVGVWRIQGRWVGEVSGDGGRVEAHMWPRCGVPLTGSGFGFICLVLKVQHCPLAGPELASGGKKCSASLGGLILSPIYPPSLHLCFLLSESLFVSLFALTPL